MGHDVVVELCRYITVKDPHPLQYHQLTLGTVQEYQPFELTDPFPPLIEPKRNTAEL